MKNQLLLLLAAVALVACIHSCSTVDHGGHYSRQDSIAFKQILKPYDSANMWKCYYNSFLDRHAKLRDSILNFCTIRTRDVLWAMGFDSATLAHGDTIIVAGDTLYRFMRVSVGYDTFSHSLRAFFQPVKGVKFDANGQITDPGKAYYFDSTGKIMYKGRSFCAGPARPKGSGTTTDTEYVADLNTPCPPTCDN